MRDRTGMIVYALIDPRDPVAAENVRYVGCSVNPERRLRRHLWEMRSARVDRLCKNPRKVVFLMWLALDGVMPEILALERVRPDRDPVVREQYWIDFFRARTGGELTNFARPLPPPEPRRAPDEYLKPPWTGGRFW
jgi:hypothetical protein